MLLPLAPHLVRHYQAVVLVASPLVGHPHLQVPLLVALLAHHQVVVLGAPRLLAALQALPLVHRPRAHQRAVLVVALALPQAHEVRLCRPHRLPRHHRPFLCTSLLSILHPSFHPTPHLPTHHHQHIFHHQLLARYHQLLCTLRCAETE